MISSPHIEGLLKRSRGAISVAVVGESQKPDGHGHAIVRNLSTKGFGVFAVNPMAHAELDARFVSAVIDDMAFDLEPAPGTRGLRDVASSAYILDAVPAVVSDSAFSFDPVSALAGPEVHPPEIPLYADLFSIPEPVDLAVFAVPPPVTFDILVWMAGILEPVIWLQPGSFDAHVVSFAQHAFEHVVVGRCIMLETLRWNDVAGTVETELS